VTDRAAELCDVLQLCLTFATVGSPEQQAAVIRDGRAALDELRQVLASRQWPRVVRGGLPPGPHFLQLDDRALTGLLADIQDAHGELQERLHTAEARLRDCQDRLQAALPASPDDTDRPEDTP
jgi:nitrate reductase assembly molybdenum cofactor insertion protein NarJ